MVSSRPLPTTPTLDPPRPTTPMSISFAHNNDFKASPTPDNSGGARGNENVSPGQAASEAGEKNVQDLEDAIRKRKSIIPSLTSELAQLEQQIKDAEERAERLSRATAQAQVPN